MANNHRTFKNVTHGVVMGLRIVSELGKSFIRFVTNGMWFIASGGPLSDEQRRYALYGRIRHNMRGIC